MGKIINVEIGQSLPKERWQEAARNLTDLGKVLARNLLAQTGTGEVKRTRTISWRTFPWPRWP